MNQNTPDTLVRLSKIIGPDGIIPISRTAFYQGINEGVYPKPLKLGKRVSAWRMSELLDALDKISSMKTNSSRAK